MKNTRKILAIILVLAAMASLAACGAKTVSVSTEASAAAAAQVEQASQLTKQDSEESKIVVEGGREGVDYMIVDAPEAANENGVITAEEWSELFPDIYASYVATADNDYIISYLDDDTYLANIYLGYGFAFDYNSAQGHEYCLEDVTGTTRPHPLANCLTCKTADFTALVNAMGADAYSLSFEDVAANCIENVGCYNCHANEAGNAGQLVVTHDYTIEKLGDEMNSINPAVLACGQCHIEYYFNPADKATTVPYTNVAEMSPDAMLEYYNSIDFADWTQPDTGARLLKAQHPEMETFLGNGSRHAAFGLSCADCHMATETSEAGRTYISHNLESPLDNPALLSTCVKCHGETDMAEKVHAIQEQVTARETVVGTALSELNDKLAAAVESGEYTEEELDVIRDVYRSAQWYFDFDYVENSEGAHNSTLANYCLDTAEAYIEQAIALFK